MKITSTAINNWSTSNIQVEEEKITPYKYVEELPHYEIPQSCRFTVSRPDLQAPDIVYYQSIPEKEGFPIAIFCTGSSTKNSISSVIHFHRYFLQECMDLGIAMVTVERWGVDGNEHNETEFMEHYTRTQRLEDHKTVIDHLKSHPLEGWNGKFIFVGASEGGPLITALTADYNENTAATINWSGTGDWSWREELWAFSQKILETAKCPHSITLGECESCSKTFPSRQDYDTLMDSAISNPTIEKDFLEMTYRYHADAMAFSPPNYQKLTHPFLVVSGAEDFIIESSDAFVQKAKEAEAPVTYLRVDGMDHYVRKRPDIIARSFEWLKATLNL